MNNSNKEFPDLNFEIPEIPEPDIPEPEEPEDYPLPQNEPLPPPPSPKKTEQIFLNIPSLILGVLINLVTCLAIWRIWPNWQGALGCLGSFLFLGFKGLNKTEIGWRAIPLILGSRPPDFLKEVLFKEGYGWTLPKPFMSAAAVDCRETTEQEFTVEELSSDRIPVRISVAAQTKVVDPSTSFDVKNFTASLKELAERTIRWAIVENEAVEIPGMKKELSENLETETRKVSIERWGRDVIQIYVKSVHLPPELEKTLTRKKIEGVEAELELTEARTLKRLIQELKEGTDLNYKEALDAIQAERGKIRRTVVEGNAGDFTKGAALGQEKEKK